MDLVLQEQSPEASGLAVGSRLFGNGFQLTGPRILVRRASIEATDLSDWPTDSPVMLRPADTEARGLPRSTPIVRS